MARAHCFRIYVVQAYINRRANRDALPVGARTTVRDQVVDLLRVAHAKETQWQVPTTLPPPGEPEKPVASITVGEPVEVEAGIVHVVVSIGESGSHRQATRRDKKPKKLTKYSPEADHFVTFLFPEEDEGDEFIVVAHTIRRRDPVPQLMRLLTAIGLEQSKAARAAEDAEREQLKAVGEKPPKRAARERLVFDRRQAADNSYLNDILASADSAKAVFTSRVVDDRSGSLQPRVGRTLSINLIGDEQVGKGRTASLRWLAAFRSDKPLTLAQGVSELGALLEEEDLVAADEVDGYDHAAVSVRDKENQSTTIAVDTLRDVFTYPVADGAPGIYYYYDKVSPRLKKVADEEKINVPEIDAAEVERCLEG